MLRFVVPVFLSAMVLRASAQDRCDIKLNFIFTETHSKKRVSFAGLQDSALSGASFTANEDGRLLLQNLCAGQHAFRISGDEILDTVLRLYVDRDATIKLRLQHDPNLLHQVVVAGKQSNLSVTRYVQQQPNETSAGKSFSEIAEQTTGVNLLRNGSNVAKPVVHGLHSNRIVMMNNGVRQEDQQWGAEHAPSMDAFGADELAVVKGASGVRYGTDAIAGVILSTPSAMRDERGTSVDVLSAAESNGRKGTLSAKLDHRFAKHPEFAFRLQGTGKQAGNYTLPDGRYVANSGFREFDVSGTFAYKGIHSQAEIFVSRFETFIGIYPGTHTGSKDDLYRAVRSDTPLIAATFSYKLDRPKQHVRHSLAKLKWQRDLRGGSWTNTYSFQQNFRQEFDIVRVDDGRAQLNLTLNTHALNSNVQHRIGSRISGNAGIDLTAQHNTFQTGDRVFIPSYYSYGLGGYISEKLRLKPFSVEGGFRYDYKHFEMYNPEGAKLENVRYLFDYRNVSAAASILGKSDRKFYWALHLAEAWRAPQAPELFSAGLHQGGARIELGNKTLKPEMAFGFNTDLALHAAKRMNISVNAYAQRISNFIYLAPQSDMLTIRGYYRVFAYLQTDAFLKGIDADADYTFNKHFRLSAKASMLRARDLKANDWLILMPSDRCSANLRYTFGGGKRFTEYFIEGKMMHVLRQSRIPANFDAIDFPQPPPAYTTVDMSAGTTINMSKQQIKISVAAENLLNRNYRDYMDLFRYFLNRPGFNAALRVQWSIH